MNNDLYATIYEEALFGKCLCKKNLKLAITDEANFIYQVCKKGAVINMQHDEEIEKCDDFMRPLGVHIKALLLVPIMGLDVILGTNFTINRRVLNNCELWPTFSTHLLNCYTHHQEMEFYYIIVN